MVCTEVLGSVPGARRDCVREQSPAAAVVAWSPGNSVCICCGEITPFASLVCRKSANWVGAQVVDRWQLLARGLSADISTRLVIVTSYGNIARRNSSAVSQSAAAGKWTPEVGAVGRRHTGACEGNKATTRSLVDEFPDVDRAACADELRRIVRCGTGGGRHDRRMHGCAFFTAAPEETRRRQASIATR